MKSINQTNEEIKDDVLKNSLYGSPNDQSNRSFHINKENDFTSTTKLNLQNFT